MREQVLDRDLPFGLRDTAVGVLPIAGGKYLGLLELGDEGGDRIIELESPGVYNTVAFNVGYGHGSERSPKMDGIRDVPARELLMASLLSMVLPVLNGCTGTRGPAEKGLGDTGGRPVYRAMDIFPLVTQHVHSPTIVTLRNGHWVLVYNDTEDGRHSLAVSISTDEGRTWPYTRHLERDTRPGNIATASHYPSIIQGRDGTLHVVYSYHRHDQAGGPTKTIKYVRFQEAWVMHR